MPLQTIFTKEFPADLASERIGWASVEEMPDNPELLAVNVVVATVGADGAKHGYHQLEGEDERMYSSRCDEGFVAVAGLFVTVSRENGVELPGGTYFRTQERKGGGGDILLNGGSGYHDLVPEDDTKSWADNGAELLGLLKEGLTRKDIATQYPTIYYSLNGMQGHDGYRSRNGLRDFTPQELLLPDSAMTKTTELQVAVVSGVVNSLEAVKVEDERMKQRLTVFSDIPATEIPEAFVKSRRAVAGHERAVLATLPKMYAPQLTYLPIGFRPNGRSWPYMDAVAKTDHEAFGMELNALETKQTGLVNYEVDREIKELEHRLEFARQGSQVLRLLLVSEQQVA